MRPGFHASRGASEASIAGLKMIATSSRTPSRRFLALKPKAILIENVKGLTRQSFHNYFTYIQYMLEFPEIGRRENEDWIDHRRRLETYVTSRGKEGYSGLRYNVVPEVVNAAKYGVPAET